MTHRTHNSEYVCVSRTVLRKTDGGVRDVTCLPWLYGHFSSKVPQGTTPLSYSNTPTLWSLLQSVSFPGVCDPDPFTHHGSTRFPVSPVRRVTPQEASRSLYTARSDSTGMSRPNSHHLRPVSDGRGTLGLDKREDPRFVNVGPTYSSLSPSFREHDP